MPQFKPYYQNQAQLLPPTLDEMLSKDHLARLINYAIDSMDFSKDRNSMSSTDKDAAMMLMKEQYPAPGCNAQLATEHQVILAYQLSSDRNDGHLMKPMVKEVKARTKNS